MIETPEIMEEIIGRDLGLEPVKVDTWIAQGDKFNALGVEVEVRHVPGHCPGNVLFYFAGNKDKKSAGAAFVGDALFAGSVGRTDLPGGSMEQLERVIRSEIYTLPDETVVFPGHGPRTTVGAEKRTNPYVQA
jgi:glyoxylase-like metal-dependent hydrolase (beta-lactamase superfamily II)